MPSSTRLRIAFEHAAIHERTRIAFVPVTDHVLHVANSLGHRAPLQPRGISAAAASAQAAFGDLLDHVIRRHLGQSLYQGLITVAGDIVVDLFRINMTGVLEHHVNLLVKVIPQVALQGCHRRTTEAGDDRVGMFRFHMLIKCLVGINQHKRPRGAQSHAAGTANQHSLALCRNCLRQLILQLVRMLTHAPGAHADVDFLVVLCVFDPHRFGDLIKLFDCHSTAHLSSCSII